MSDRTTALRAELVDRARREGTPRRIRATVVTAVIAFAVGGGVVGGGLSAAAAVAPQQASPSSTAAPDAFDYLMQGGHVSGPLRAFQGPGDTDFDLGPRPADATAIAVVVTCKGFGHFDLTFGGEAHKETCTGGTTYGDTSQTAPIGSRVQLVQGDDKFTYSLWAEWISIPPPAAPSAAQLAEVADGVITDEEAQDAVNRYLACAYGAGYAEKLTSLSELSFEGVGPGQGTPAESNALSRCSEAELSQVSIIWGRQQGRP
jgi:hypothetical protein